MHCFIESLASDMVATPLAPSSVSSTDDLLAGLYVIASLIFILVMVRIFHLYMARKSMVLANYHSSNQWIASITLNILAVSTGFFTLFSIIFHICILYIGNESLDELFYVSINLQSLCVSLFPIVCLSISPYIQFH